MNNITNSNDVEIKGVTPIYEILSSKGIVKILYFLYTQKLYESSISVIAKNAKLNHGNCSTHLISLSKQGLIIEKRFGRIRIYQMNLENKIAKALIQFFSSI